MPSEYYTFATLRGGHPTETRNEETFRAVAPLYRFKTDADAIKMSNDTEL